MNPDFDFNATMEQMIKGMISSADSRVSTFADTITYDDLMAMTRILSVRQTPSDGWVVMREYPHTVFRAKDAPQNIKAYEHFETRYQAEDYHLVNTIKRVEKELSMCKTYGNMALEESNFEKFRSMQIAIESHMVHLEKLHYRLNNMENDHPDWFI